MRRRYRKKRNLFEDLDTSVVYDNRTSPSQTFDEAVNELEDALLKPFLLTLTDLLVERIDENVGVGQTKYPIKGHRNVVFEAEIEVNGQLFVLE